MKKSFKLILVTVLVMVMVSAMPVFGANEITVYKDGQQITFDAPIYIKDGLTMVPMRSIAEAVGCLVVWRDSDKSAYVSGDTGTWKEIDITMLFTLGSSTAYYTATSSQMRWNHEEIAEYIPIGTAVEIANGRVMLPLRFLAENLGFNVQWNNETKRIDISSNTTSGAPDFTTTNVDNDSYEISDEQKAINNQYVELFDEPLDSYPGAYQ